MRIAIPTNNMIVVSNDTREAKYFKVVTFKGMEIVNEEFRSNPLKGDDHFTMLSGKEADRVLTLLYDCDVLIIGEKDNLFNCSRISSHLNIRFSNRQIATSAALEYNYNYIEQESNSCCSP
jgi:hypothetical protein